MRPIECIEELLVCSDFTQRSSLLRELKGELKRIFGDVAPRKYFFLKEYPELFISKRRVCLEFKTWGSPAYRSLVAQLEGDLKHFFIMDVEADSDKIVFFIKEEKPWMKNQ